MFNSTPAAVVRGKHYHQQLSGNGENNYVNATYDSINWDKELLKTSEEKKSYESPGAVAGGEGEY